MITSHRSCSIPGAVVCTIGRGLDFRNAAYFYRQYDELLEQGYRYFILDFSATEVFDSSGLGSIFGLQKRLLPDGGRLVFASPSRSVVTVLRLIRSERMFRTYPSVEAALADLPDVHLETEPAPTPTFIPEVQVEETVPVDTIETLADTPLSEEPAVSDEPAPLGHAPEVRAAAEEVQAPSHVEVASSPLPESEAAAARAASTTAAPIAEPVVAEDSPGMEAEQGNRVPDGPEGDGIASGARFVTHKLVYTGNTPEPAPSTPSPTPVSEELPQDNAPDRTAFRNLLDRLRSNGLIQGYTLEPARVRLHLFEDGQPLDMDYAGAEAFCLDLKRSLPGF